MGLESWDSIPTRRDLKSVFIGDGAKQGNPRLAREMRKPYDYSFVS